MAMGRLPSQQGRRHTGVSDHTGEEGDTGRQGPVLLDTVMSLINRLFLTEKKKVVGGSGKQGQI